MKNWIVVLCLFLFSGLSSQNTWEKKESFGNDKRSRCVSFSIGNRGYFGCGEDTADMVRNDLWEYDPGTDSWMQRASLPGPARRDAVGIAIGNNGYVGTGIDAAESAFGNNLNDWWEYNPATNTWLQRANYPGSTSFNGIYFGCGFTIGAMGYVVGGKQSNSNYSSALWQYNPATNVWTQKTSFAGGTRYAMSAFVINGIAYAGLGTDEDVLQTSWWSYNPTTNAWTQKGNFPGTGRFAAAGFSIGPKGYVVGGADGGYKDELWQYDPVSDTWWTKAPFGGGERRSLGVFVIANAAYAGCGSGFTGKRRDFWQYEQFVTDVNETSGWECGLYPNPCGDMLSVNPPQSTGVFPGSCSLSVFTIDGKNVVSEDVSNRTTAILNTSALSAGVYFVVVTAGEWRSQTKFIKH